VRTLLAKVALAAGLSWLIATLAFLSMHTLPGDLALQVAGSRFVGTPPDTGLADGLRAAYGLDRPILVQYGDWLAHVLRLDLGRSLVTGRPVADELSFYLGNSLALGAVGLAGAVLVALPLGHLAGSRPGGTADRLTAVYCGLLAAVPAFLLGVLLIRIVVVDWGMGTLSGDGSFGRLALPGLVVALVASAPLLRVVRNAVAHVTRQPYFFFARMRGVPSGRLFLRHGLRNASLPVLAYMSTLYVFLLYDLVVVEVVFNYPGIGYALHDAIKARDLPVIQGATLTLVLAYLLLTAATDLVSQRLDPRIGRSGRP